jgi:hypothetical protein
MFPPNTGSDSTSGDSLAWSETFWGLGAAVGRGFGAAATMKVERYFEAGEGAKAV